ncbi:hypothetical protein A4H97_23925 [Niastella yeongjuensis]|uniref:Uncharacterized protein n=1 Tax=Niastella yeongjuensis TaxID=354355 RepID=A0A1V9F319_9BACT|nr:hypothetical protein [Niastella yeongjuensis]OQP52758.1 hypothetical protein A4H97_23925 [Niastella yeongjuensis]SEP19014.1 hypothetical protein SAMN05660816_04672 [Niastella yeongjuensis]
MVHKNLISLEKDEEREYLDELLRELQFETLNDEWGYWHFSLLNLEEGENLTLRICNTLSDIPVYKDPYWVDNKTGVRTYIPFADLKNLTLEAVADLKSEFIELADHWANYQAPSLGKDKTSEKFHSWKYEVADKIVAFLQSKEIKQVAQVCGVDILYTSGTDEIGEDLLVETQSGVYVIHFGFSA